MNTTGIDSKEKSNFLSFEKQQRQKKFIYFLIMKMIFIFIINYNDDYDYYIIILFSTILFYKQIEIQYVSSVYWKSDTSLLLMLLLSGMLKQTENKTNGITTTSLLIIILLFFCFVWKHKSNSSFYWVDVVDGGDCFGWGWLEKKIGQILLDLESMYTHTKAHQQTY